MAPKRDTLDEVLMHLWIVEIETGKGSARQC